MFVRAAASAGGIQVFREEGDAVDCAFYAPGDPGWEEALAILGRPFGDAPSPPPSPAEILAARRMNMTITPRQLFIGMVQAGFCTPEEGVAAATTGAMPEAVETAISGLSTDAQVAARITWARMQSVERLNPLVDLLGNAVGISAEQIDAFFEASASI